MSSLLEKYHSRGVDLPSLAGEVRHIVVTRTDHIGDLLLSMPLLRSLRQGLPEAEIRAVVAPCGVEVLSECPYVDKVCVFVKGDRRQNNELVTEMRAWGVDVAVAAAPRSDDYRLCRLFAAKYRCGFLRRELGTRIFYAWYCLNQYVMCDYKRSRESLAEQIACLSELLGLNGDDTSLEFFFNSEAKCYARRLQEVWGRPTVLLHFHWRWFEPSYWKYNGFTYQWEFTDFVNLVDRLLSLRSDCRLLITYGPTELPLLDECRRALQNLPGGAPYMLDGTAELPESIEQRVVFVGGLSVQRWAALIASAQVVVSPDTGAVHLAAATHVPVVAAYLPNHYLHSNWYLFQPWQVPCAKLVRFNPGLTTRRILTSVTALLEGKNAASDIVSFP